MRNPEDEVDSGEAYKPMGTITSLKPKEEKYDNPEIEYNEEKNLAKEKYILKRKRGTRSPTRGGIDKDAENQQLIEIPEEDEESDSSDDEHSEDLEEQFFDELEPEDLKILLKRLKQEARSEKRERKKRKKAKKEKKKRKKASKDSDKNTKKKHKR